MRQAGLLCKPSLRNRQPRLPHLRAILGRRLSPDKLAEVKVGRMTVTREWEQDRFRKPEFEQEANPVGRRRLLHLSSAVAKAMAPHGLGRYRGGGPKESYGPGSR